MFGRRKPEQFGCLRSVYCPHPVLFILGPNVLVFASFENHLAWAPSLDGHAGFARTSLA